MKKRAETSDETQAGRIRYDETTRRLLDRIERGRALAPYTAAVDRDETSSLVLEALADLHRLAREMHGAVIGGENVDETDSLDLESRLAAAAERYRALAEAKRRESS